MIKVVHSCPHKNCTVKGGHPVSFTLPDICGVLDCSREAKTSIRIGFTFYKVCMIHAQGTIEADTKTLVNSHQQNMICSGDDKTHSSASNISVVTEEMGFNTKTNYDGGYEE